MDTLIEKIKEYAMGENRKYKEASEDYYVELKFGIGQHCFAEDKRWQQKTTFDG